MSDVVENAQIITPTMMMLLRNKQGGYEYRWRRHQDWLENYELYRDHVTINRLVQRQSVNIAIMKQTIRTLMKDVDDMPVLYFENLDNDKQAEIFKNEYWKWTQDYNNMELQDIIDKKQVFLFGRSFDQWQVIDGKIVMTVQDTMDILVSRYTNPYDIHSSRFLIHNHIYVPLSKLKQDPMYDKEAVKELEAWYKTEAGLLKLASNQEMLAEKNQKMSDMGDGTVESPTLGEVIVELSIHEVFRNEDKDGQPMIDSVSGETIDEQIMVYIEADDQQILLEKPLEDVIDPQRNCKDHFWRNHYNYNTWADDIERQDFWNDAIADAVRGNNKIINVFYSQKIENRTLRSFGMRFYDATTEGFNPQTYQPIPFGFYGVPGKPTDIMQNVDIPDLAEVTQDIEFIMGVNEKVSGATAALQGAENTSQITLGEAQMDLTEAKSRIKGMSKFYTKAWKDRGMMFVKLLEAAGDNIDAVKIYKKGRVTSNIYSREIGPSDWQSKEGYNVKVWSQDDKDNQNNSKLQKITIARQNMPGNKKLEEIYEQTVLEFADLDPDQINDIMQEQEQLRQQQAMMGQMAQNQQLMGGNAEPAAPMGAPPQLPASAAPALPAGGGPK